ncbi:t-SNARE [Rhizodiscina lignyota]|uniref:t-SNARE n=1 Tax=Rhizodiscina lignyota TaxID=1504668 RepID=A0A9P4IK25_9PEZI|nr:t-SNARE [Rhizodiscina lignyota]
MAQQYQQGGGYAQQNPYDQRNPYDHRDDNMEMEPLSPNQAYTAAPGGGSSDPNKILNDCQEVDRALDAIDAELNQLRGLHRRRLNAAETDNATTQQIDRLSTDIMTSYRGLVERMRRLKGLPESDNPRNSPQVGRVDRRLKATINNYQTLERDFRHGLQDQQSRQYRIVRPEATEEEIQEAIDDPNAQIFQQALLNSDRRGQAQRTLGAVNERHKEIQKIERQMVELAQLFTDLENIIVQQEPLVQNIEQKGEEVHDNMLKANTELGGAVVSARGARKKKWICLGICVAIIIIVLIIVLVYLATQGVFSGKKNN